VLLVGKLLFYCFESPVDLFESLIDLFESLIDLFNSVVDLFNSLVDLFQSVVDLFDSLTDLFQARLQCRFDCNDVCSCKRHGVFGLTLQISNAQIRLAKNCLYGFPYDLLVSNTAAHVSFKLRKTSVNPTRFATSNKSGISFS